MALPKLGRSARVMTLMSGTPPLSAPTYIQVTDGAGTNLPAGTYEYAVCATADSKFSPLRGWVQKTTTTSKNLTISWDTVSGASGYRVFKRSAPNWQNIYYQDTTGLSITDTNTGWTLATSFGVDIQLLHTWSLDITCDEVDGSTFGTTWGVTLPGAKTWRMSLDGYFNPSANLELTKVFDAPILDLMLITHGDPKTSESFIISPGTTDTYYDGGTATASLRFNADVNGLVQVTVNVLGQGSLILKSI